MPEISIQGAHAISRVLATSFRTGGLLLALAFCGCCARPAQPATLTFFDSEGLGTGRHGMISSVYLQEFTQKTEIRINDLPTPEDNGSKLALAGEMFRSGATSPDVYGIDTIWSGILNQYLIDLQPYFASEIPSQDRDILDSYLVQRKLVAMPYHPNVQVLMYRTDLLAKYGYKTPPKTWDELEKMAVRIQTGERAQGKKDFWGIRLVRIDRLGKRAVNLRGA